VDDEAAEEQAGCAGACDAAVLIGGSAGRTSPAAVELIRPARVIPAVVGEHGPPAQALGAREEGGEIGERGGETKEGRRKPGGSAKPPRLLNSPPSRERYCKPL